MSKERIITIVVSWIIVVITMVMIFNFSFQDSETSTSTSDEIVDKIVDVIPNGDKITQPQKQGIRISVRKLAHFGIYMLLGFTLINAMRNSFRIKSVFLILATFLISFIYSIIDEFFIQGHTEGRAPQWTDVLIDTSGALIGILVFVTIIFIINFVLKKIKQKKEIL